MKNSFKEMVEWFFLELQNPLSKVSILSYVFIQAVLKPGLIAVGLYFLFNFIGLWIF